ncbi:hypothetical protein A2Y99_01920 [Candidatus Gottesmanbacteria bacterium RBG_13_37_7]|uniref:Transposase IS200-like domain-containing protein n=1 Tax=Candidatus Gottesmanbacteria bacterium RBG_13_37_7 TaxID=1798369 RepID=A0A1F5YKC4_9BACT|nr:MAG: hypothetical protein A2Y99_01920 [Candidatus Gottesmanbacteria bacterium RBG_13_37_7]
MPGRIIPLINEQVYHVFNRGIDKRPTFISKIEYKRAVITLDYYQFIHLPEKLSKFLITAEKERIELLLKLRESGERLVEIISYVLMPNHFHLLLRQKIEGGISKYLSNVQNSYTRYFNIIHQRKGPLFLDQFKAVRVESDEQLLHVSRYIHLNPYTSYVVAKQDKLKDYIWSSLSEYLDNRQDSICEKETILSFYNKKDNYGKFIYDQADYQRNLDSIKHLVLDGEC